MNHDDAVRSCPGNRALPDDRASAATYEIIRQHVRARDWYRYLGVSGFGRLHNARGKN
ncbi:MAG: hypothetical protein IPG97_14180 [Microthrixaceae bacterium]|nr:hypothetical protein [Microthrixaceae bacterium]